MNTVERTLCPLLMSSGQLVEQVALVRDPPRAVIPEVMVGVADRQLGLEGRFLRQGQPVISAEWHDRSSGSEG